MKPLSSMFINVFDAEQAYHILRWLHIQLASTRFEFDRETFLSSRFNAAPPPRGNCVLEATRNFPLEREQHTFTIRTALNCTL